jgi:hypothetical protein
MQLVVSCTIPAVVIWFIITAAIAVLVPLLALSAVAAAAV